MRWLTSEQLVAWRSFLDSHMLLMTRLERESVPNRRRG